MTKKFYIWKILSLMLIGFFLPQAQAMEDVEKKSNSIHLNAPAPLDTDEEIRNIFTKASSSQINKNEAIYFMRKAPLSRIGDLLLLGNESSQLLKKKILKFHSLYRSRCFEIITYLCTSHISITEEEKEDFLKKLAGHYGDVVFDYCKKGDPYLTFLQDNKATLQKGAKGYMMLHKATDFWSAWVEYIESDPSLDDWKKAEYYHEHRRRQETSITEREEYKERAESYSKHEKYLLKKQKRNLNK